MSEHASAVIERIRAKTADQGIIDDAALDEMVHDSFANKAAEVNNGGLETQVPYLLADGVSADDIVRRAS